MLTREQERGKIKDGNVEVEKSHQASWFQFGIKVNYPNSVKLSSRILAEDTGTQTSYGCIHPKKKEYGWLMETLLILNESPSHLSNCSKEARQIFAEMSDIWKSQDPGECLYSFNKQLCELEQVTSSLCFFPLSSKMKNIKPFCIWHKTGCEN